MTGHDWREFRQELSLPNTLPGILLLRGEQEEHLRNMGFLFGDPVEGCYNYVQYVRFPDGWAKVPCVPSDQEQVGRKMWVLVDTVGNGRAIALDNDYFRLRCFPRFYIQQDVFQGIAVEARITDRRTGAIVHTTPSYPYPPGRDSDSGHDDKFGEPIVTSYGKALDAAFADARTWLIDNYPDYEDPCKYWDD